MTENKKTNRLIHQKSPYLLQHAHNPVDWYPWGEEAFEVAFSNDFPIFSKYWIFFVATGAMSVINSNFRQSHIISSQK